ncbi:hypothetical protein A0H81_07874 [Grifola frondosa]|uniref:Uncharacterized protein n=1 Tax=Grifola frondosa TaxID=5627 RepID=A0A1C7M7V1_GRIFR|nr:hypothetical protein A0H81_07874 [Grifola frondosa]
MSSANASSSTAAPSAPKQDELMKDEDSQPQLLGLEEDDEFEEFEVADWEDSQTDLAHLGGAAPGAANVQLRNELAKKAKGNGGGAEPMTH